MSEGSHIELRGVRAYGRHGANPGEREHLQPLDIALRLELDLGAARRSDLLSDTIDYRALHRRVVEIVRTTSFALLERLGQCILDEVFADERVTGASVTLAKPQGLGNATPAVTVHSSRRGGR